MAGVSLSSTSCCHFCLSSSKIFLDFSFHVGNASPSKSPMPCWPHQAWRHGWISYHFFVPRKSKIKRSPKSTEQSMKSPGSLLGARHLDRYKTMYPRVSVMTLQSPHHAAREKHLDWWFKFCSGKSENPWIHVEFTDWLYRSILCIYIYNMNYR